MIKEFVDKYNENKGRLEEIFKAGHPDDYIDIIKAVVTILNPEGEYGGPDIERIHQIDDGDYQGTLFFAIAETGYQPDTYWAVTVGYGSCSGCDTLQAISGYSSESPDDQQVKDYMTLALHVVQGLKKI